MNLIEKICNHLSERIENNQLSNEDCVAEIWKFISGYEGLYEISNFGRVKSLTKKGTTKEKYLRPGRSSKGYLNVVLTKNNKTKNLKVHRLVAQAFIPNPENKPEVNHKNGIKSDNRHINLEWVTTSENVRHAFKSIPRNNVVGERCFKSKLNKEQVLEIRNIGRSKTLKELSLLYKISEGCISKIIRRESWKHLL